MINAIYNFGIFILIAFVLASYLGKWFWICDILANFRLYYIIVSIIFLLLALIFKNKIGALLLLVVIAVQAFTVYQSYSKPRLIGKAIISEKVNILQYNVHYLNKKHPEYFLFYDEKGEVIYCGKKWKSGPNLAEYPCRYPCCQ